MNFENRYSLIDRILHRFAFSFGPVLAAVSDMEDRMYLSKLKNIESQKPVFVTGLPRSGTTTILNLLVETNEFASHTYRDMPFMITPILWNKFQSIFGVTDTLRERAHQDGIKINIDSPEALEEIIWMLFWKDHYKEKYIIPWEVCDDQQFLCFFNQHMKKVIMIRSGEQHARYISKNNLNISRLPALSKAFPDAVILVPFRSPIQQSASLLNQHVRFIKLHNGDSFIKDYMAGIGHFDFGCNLRPINFNNWVEKYNYLDPTTLDFWLAYWIETYEYVIKQFHENIQIVSYEYLTLNPKDGIKRLASSCSVNDKNKLFNLSEKLHRPRVHSIDIKAVDKNIIEAALDLEERLESNSK